MGLRAIICTSSGGADWINSLINEKCKKLEQEKCEIKGFQLSTNEVDTGPISHSVMITYLEPSER